MNFTDYLFEQSGTSSRAFLLQGEREISHRKLHASVEALAHRIQERYGKGNEMLLLADNSLFFIVAYLAIMQSGNTVVLLETRLGDEDLARIRATCSLRACFVQERYASRFPASADLYTEKVLEEESEAGEALPATRPEEVAVIIFTSGSTGVKKGVMLTHANLIANTASILAYLRLSAEDRICVVLPFYYCYGASLLHTHLRVGGSVVLSSLIFPTALFADLRRFACTGLAGVPSTFQILATRTSFLREEFPALRYCTQAGGQLPRKYIELILDAFPHKAFYVMYGATEATARLSYLSPSLARSKMGSIGRGIPGVRLEVRGPDGSPVLPGEIGEIVAQGENIMKGYYRDAEATAQALREGWLYTGDLATVDEEGFIYIVGRSKNIIKSGGFRISPLEIEDFIITLPDVQGCVVIGLPDDLMGEAVVAVIQADATDRDTLAAGILRACMQKFPSHKVPRIIEFVDEFPLNSSQKVDRDQLTLMVQDRKERKESISSPSRD